MKRTNAATVAVLAGAWACGGGAARSAESATASAAHLPIYLIAERWVSTANPAWDVDTPALWTDGQSSVVLVTGKGTHDLQLFDGESGEHLGALGRQGTRRGEFNRPNGVIVVGDYAFVVERDNRRVQVLGMPDGASLGTFGSDVLRYPYGLAAAGTPDHLVLWVTDDYEDVEDVVPDDLTKRLHRFELAQHGRSNPELLRHRTFGEPKGEGSLRVVESVQVDGDARRVFVADESRKQYLEYDFDGVYQDRALGAGDIEGDPEGLVLVRCADGGGYWVATDQQEKVTLFRIYDRSTLEPIAIFQGAVTANTDGTSFEHGPVPGFPGGVLYAVHDDQAISAFDWTEIATRIGLPSECGVR